ncbi:hypothetical protein ACE193_03495 [Bernardetia sp. OM2101]
MYGKCKDDGNCGGNGEERLGIGDGEKERIFLKKKLIDSEASTMVSS